MPKPNVLTEDEKIQIKRLHARGVSILRISHQFEISPNTVRWHLGLVPRRTKATSR